MSLIDKQTAYEVLTDYYHHSTEQQHKALREALDRVPSVETAADTISRKKTLERLTNISYNLCKTEAENKIIEYAKTMVITMPSAQTKTQLSEEDTTSDCISRQAAIDAVHEEFDGCLVWDESGEHTANEVERILDRVPSAQPEASQVARDIATIIENERDMRVISELKTGRWVEMGQNEDGTHNICCGVCGKFKIKSRGHANSDYTKSKYRFCGGCGAKMEVERG